MKDCLQVYFFISFVAQRAGSKKLDVKVVTREGFETVYTEDEMGTNYQDYALAGNNGEDALSPEELEKVLGREITPLADALKELI